jgi:hypothetical protein
MASAVESASKPPSASPGEVARPSPGHRSGNCERRAMDPMIIAAGVGALHHPVVETVFEHAKHLAEDVGGHILHEKYREIKRHV